MPSPGLQAAVERRGTRLSPGAPLPPGESRPAEEPERQQGGGYGPLRGWEGGGSLSRTPEVGADLETEQKKGKGMQTKDGWGRD